MQLTSLIGACGLLFDIVGGSAATPVDQALYTYRATALLSHITTAEQANEASLAYNQLKPYLVSVDDPELSRAVVLSQAIGDDCDRLVMEAK